MHAEEPTDTTDQNAAHAVPKRVVPTVSENVTLGTAFDGQRLRAGHGAKLLNFVEVPMKKFVFAMLTLAVVGGSVLYVDVETAQAVPPFKKEFDALYVKKDSADPNEKSLAEAVGKVKCNVCHVGKDKKKRNAYGQQLAKLLTKKDKDPSKIKGAIEKVAAEHSDPNNSNSPTFGDLIKQGMLPGGNTE